MLKKFSVSNYRRFKEAIEFDLTASQYAFNTDCVQHNLVKLALIYGKNGTGKSNLAWAMFDLISHLTDNENNINKENYINSLSNREYAQFRFEFEFFDKNLKAKEVIYEYSKDENTDLISEALFIDHEEVINYQVGQPFYTSLSGTEHLNKNLSPSQKISAVKYIYRNSNLDSTDSHNAIFIKFIAFINKMLYFRSVIEERSYIGYKKGGEDIQNYILSNNLQEFENFLNDFGLNLELKSIEVLNKKIIGIKMGKKVLPFFSVISTGTLSLTLFYYWWTNLKKEESPLLFIDEFDCSYHFELSEGIINKLKELPNTQVILTTHNTNLLSNELIRPDCGYIINGETIKSLNKSTKKELREAHNLERLYQAGEFNNGR